MRIAVLGAGSWGTTVASLLAGRHDCVIWSRDPELAREIYERDANSRYLPGFTLPSALTATADLEKAVHDTDLLVVGVPTQGLGVADNTRAAVVCRGLAGQIPASAAYRGLSRVKQAGHERDPG